MLTVRRKTHSLCFLIVLTFVFTRQSFAADLDLSLDAFCSKVGDCQEGFRQLAEEAGLVLQYTPLAPAEPLGVIGFDAGLEVSAADIGDRAPFWKAAFPSPPPSFLAIPKLHVQKGIPFGIDLGLSLGKIPGSNISLVGGEIKWALLHGTIVTPALALRGSFSRLLGVDDLDLSTVGADLSISQQVAFVTPYAGIGQLWISASPNAAGLNDENISRTKGLLGVKVSFLLVNLVGEVDLASIAVYSVRLNVGF